MEQKAIYRTENTRSIPQTWAVQMLHVAMVSDLVSRGVGKNASEVVRQAIEAFYKQQELVEA